jgi:hypothetical protein
VVVDNIVSHWTWPYAARGGRGLSHVHSTDKLRERLDRIAKVRVNRGKEVVR